MHFNLARAVLIAIRCDDSPTVGWRPSIQQVEQETRLSISIDRELDRTGRFYVVMLYERS